MNSGYLRLIVLQELYGKEHTGYSLIKKVSEISSKKPSSGSVYPLLKKLLSEKAIRQKKSGRKKYYIITKKGKILFEKVMEEKNCTLINHIRFVDHIKLCMDKKQRKSTEKTIKELMEGNNKLLYYMGDWIELRDIAMLLLSDKRYDKKQREIQKVVADTVLKLRRIKNEKN